MIKSPTEVLGIMYYYQQQQARTPMPSTQTNPERVGLYLVGKKGTR